MKQNSQVSADSAAADGEPGKLSSRVSRRRFIQSGAALSAGIGGAALIGSDSHAETPGTTAESKWTAEVDVVVCGTGAAGLTAAICAATRGQRVLMLEKAPVVGGTTAKSGGVWWVPNNPLMRRDGYADSKQNAVAYMARCSFPNMYDPSLPQFGLRPAEYELLEAYCDNALAVTEELLNRRALSAAYFTDVEGAPTPDYYSHLPEDQNRVGRSIMPADEKGAGIPTGTELVRQLKAEVDRLGIRVLLEHQAERLIVNSSGRVCGVQARHAGQSYAFGGCRGVVFATGGFTHNAAMADNYLRGPVFGGCAVPSNTGDFVVMSSQVGAGLGNMNQAWWCELVLEQALAYASVPSSAFILCGDSMLVVNRFGHRIYNEKTAYNERTQAHFDWDPVRAEYPNLLTFMIYDDRVARDPGDFGAYPIPEPGFDAPYVIHGQTLPLLAANIDARLRALAGRSSVAARVSSSFHLAPDFLARLEQTVLRFNGFARTGIDTDFQRGTTKFEHAFFGRQKGNDKPGATLFPLAERGPYHCIILGGGTLDTKGGPQVNAKAQVLDVHGQVIAGLYAAGNCVASPARQAYWGSGATIGAAMAFGYLAAVNASADARCCVSI